MAAWNDEALAAVLREAAGEGAALVLSRPTDAQVAQLMAKYPAMPTLRHRPKLPLYENKRHQARKKDLLSMVDAGRGATILARGGSIWCDFRSGLDFPMMRFQISL